MKIKTKLILQAIFLAVVPATTLALLITLQANQASFAALESETKARLITLREMKKAQITDYLTQINAQMVTFSSNLSVIDAAKQLSNSFLSTQPDEQQLADGKTKVKDYYLNDFNQAFIDKNHHSAPSIEQNFTQLDDLAIHYQNQYIANNPFPLGKKNKQLTAGNTEYDTIHQKYHPMFSRYLAEFGFYDIFIVDAKSGHVVYSVFKELDYGTSLINGPFKASGLANAFKQALQLDDQQQTVLVDFDSYFPSYNQAASFIASPIGDNNGDNNGDITAVLIFQMPIDGINKIMTNDQQWQQVGLGSSGETYLVGPDNTLRSESRFLLEDKDNYYQALKNSGVQPNLEQIKAYNSALGLQLVNTSGAQTALTGSSGFQQFKDYRDIAVLSAFTSIDYGKKKWALMAEIDVDEAFADAIALSDKLYLNAMLSLLGICVISITIGLLIAKYLVSPLNILVNRINDISEGEGDLTVKLALAQRQDEIGAVGKAFNHFVEKIRVIISEIDRHAGHLASSSEELSAVTNETNNIVGLQKSKTDLTTQVMSEFSSSINEIADNSLHTATLTEQANEESAKGANLSQQAQQAIHGLVDSVNIAADELAQLNQQVEQITSILSVIDSIADQTNLLALNAAIEAARAGESGRGFSVVADEVRTLAAKTQESTVEIQQKIEGLKNSSVKSVFAMTNASQEAEKGISLVKETALSLSTLSHLIADVSNKNTENATVAKQQSISVGDVHQNIVDIANYTDDTSSASLQTAQSSSELAKLAVNMSGLVQQFKY